VLVLGVLDGLQIAWLRDPALDLASAWAGFADVWFAPYRSAPSGCGDQR
jgi:hypothetical protein